MLGSSMARSDWIEPDRESFSVLLATSGSQQKFRASKSSRSVASQGGKGLSVGFRSGVVSKVSRQTPIHPTPRVTVDPARLRTAHVVTADLVALISIRVKMPQISHEPPQMLRPLLDKRKILVCAGSLVSRGVQTKPKAAAFPHWHDGLLQAAEYARQERGSAIRETSMLARSFVPLGSRGELIDVL